MAKDDTHIETCACCAQTVAQRECAVKVALERSAEFCHITIFFACHMTAPKYTQFVQFDISFRKLVFIVTCAAFSNGHVCSYPIGHSDF